MKLRQKITLAKDFFLVRFLRKKIPLFVGFRLTNRCNLRCKYCRLPKTKELSTNKIFMIIDDLKKQGTLRINFTGGEPLLRKDLRLILDYTKNKGIHTSLTSNGTLIKDKINSIKSLDSITISIDGPNIINKKTRSKKNYKKLTEGIRLVKKNNIKLNFSCVISKHNAKHIKDILKIGKKYNTNIYFQPVTDFFNGEKNLDNVFCSKNDYNTAIDYLIRKKKAGENIGNSISGLKYLRNWPNKTKINCAAGKVRCRIEANGEVYPCNRITNKKKYNNLLETGFKNAFSTKIKPECDGCWCANHVELNLIYDLNIDAIFNSFNKF